MTYLLPHSYTGCSSSTGSLTPATTSLCPSHTWWLCIFSKCLSLSWQLVTINSDLAQLRNETTLFTASGKISVSAALHCSPWTASKWLLAAGASPAGYHHWEVGHVQDRASTASDGTPHHTVVVAGKWDSRPPSTSTHTHTGAAWKVSLKPRQVDHHC